MYAQEATHTPINIAQIIHVYEISMFIDSLMHRPNGTIY
jgi:hypothetical protein